MNWLRRGFLMLLGVGPMAVAGCTPVGMGLLTPVPVQPWVAERMEEKYLHKNDQRTPIMPPVREGYPEPLCEDAPTEREVIRTLQKVARGVPFVYEEFRDDIRVNSERIVDKIDPPRFFPLVGWARLHHCHWKCTVYYTETIQSDYPFPAKLKKRRVQVLYIDKDHLHLFVGQDPDVQKDITREFTDYAP
ncbi:hypothetical protein [Zavarzinella formosa]|uniref:hypothetical protein n=1 Tax=Zavarzinella formosa TaxID=360055 RepID=UPI0002DE6B0D|nr:hypothetical protein [Zavarzinella formosa]